MHRWIAGAGIAAPLAALVATLVVAPRAHAQSPVQATADAADPVDAGLTSFLRAFATSFRFTGGAKEDAARLASIEACVQEMFFIARPFARSRLSNSTEIAAGIAFEVRETEGQTVFVLDPHGDEPLRVPTTGKSFHFENDAGDVLEVSLQREGEKLILRTGNAQGAEKRVLWLSPDGKKLTIEVTIFASRLPRSVHYRLSYLRQPKARSPLPK